VSRSEQELDDRVLHHHIRNPAGHGFTQTTSTMTLPPTPSSRSRASRFGNSCSTTLARDLGQLSYALRLPRPATARLLHRRTAKGQDDGKLLIIAAHIPIKPQSDVSTGDAVFPFSARLAFTDDSLLRRPSQLPEPHPVDFGTHAPEHRDRAAVVGRRPSRTRLLGSRDRGRSATFLAVPARSTPAATATIRSSMVGHQRRSCGGGRVAGGKVAGVRDRRPTDIRRQPRHYRGYDLSCLQCRACETIEFPRFR